ncbi:hypothetical protein PF006_g29375 [Phytophthora fragariae]|uniref:Uncharacterized protein n=1 Tax=Phytophthora fragariae TaxID=53985 RepID=A0A6A3Q7R3_9STRA|nr:hypothetical protein PF006_g29375 [Phytophthora fragariae]KAE9168215.1 hypothetical protein PF004_g28577 [Phytophthora fragariae]
MPPSLVSSAATAFLFRRFELCGAAAAPTVSSDLVTTLAASVATLWPAILVARGLSGAAAGVELTPTGPFAVSPPAALRCPICNSASLLAGGISAWFVPSASFSSSPNSRKILSATCPSESLGHRLVTKKLQCTTRCSCVLVHNAPVVEARVLGDECWADPLVGQLGYALATGRPEHPD